MDSFKILIVGPMFIVLLIVIYQTIKQSKIFNTTTNIILSICVSVLATTGIKSHLKDSIGVLLIPYAAMAIAILAVLLIAFISKYIKKIKDCLAKHCTKYHSENDDVNSKG